MTTYKERLNAELGDSVKLNYPSDKAMRKLYGFSPSVVLQENPAIGFEILNTVAGFFNLQFRDVCVVGSAHTGYTYFKKRDFLPAQSDLDLAIIDADLYKRYSEYAFGATSGYTDLTGFDNSYESFKNYMLRGIFRPDLMPRCSQKNSWFIFFNKLSEKYSELFENINCGIYFSDQFFEFKQAPLYAEYKKENV